MFKKFLISALITAAVANSLIITAGAENSLFISDEYANDIKSNMYNIGEDSEMFVFGEKSPGYDFSNAMIFYYVDFSKSETAEKASDLFCYEKIAVPVVNKNGKAETFAELKQISDNDKDDVLEMYSSPKLSTAYNMYLDMYENHLGEWDVVGSSTGGFNAEFYDFITAESSELDNILSYDKAYITENYNNEDTFGILLVNEDEEIYFSFSKYYNGEENAVISGEEFLENVKKAYADIKALKASLAEGEDMPASGIDSDYEDYSEFDSIPEIQEEQLFLTKKDGKIYYEFETGGYLTGWQTIDENKYFFKKSGEAVTRNATIGDLKYKFNSDGVCEELFKGWTKKSGKYYYYKDGKMLKSCWLKINGKRTYYLRKDGSRAVGKLKIGGKTYNFDKSGKLIEK